MQEESRATHTLGVESNGQVFRFAVISRSSKGIVIESMLELPAENGVKPLYNSEQKDQIQQFIAKNLVVTALDTHHVLIRPLEIQLRKISDIDAALSFQVEPILPYSIDQAIVDRLILERKKEGTRLTIISTRKDYLSEHLEFWGQLDIEPEVVTCVPVALAAFSGYRETPFYSIHIGYGETTAIVVIQGKLISAKSCAIGIHHLLSENPSNPLESAAFEQLVLEITRLLYFHDKQLRGMEIKEVIITGEGTEILDFDESLAAKIDKHLIDPDHQGKVDLSSKKAKRFAIPIGSAMTALNKGPDQVNFRQAEFVFPNPWKRVKRPMMVFGSLCLVLALVGFLFSAAKIQYKQDQLKERFVSLIGALEIPYQDFERGYQEKRGRKGAEVLIPIKDLTEFDIADRIRYIESLQKEVPETFPLFPNIPRVSDTLAWLSAHDIVLGNQATEEAAPGTIQLEKFSYKLIKRPEKNRPQDRYQVKVDLEFSTTSPRTAREFHDALLEPNDFVDLSNEVKWNATRGRYFVSFYLKDKTFYPPSK